MPRLLFWGMSLVVLAGSVSPRFNAGAVQAPAPDRFVLRNARLIDGDGRVLADRGALLVERGRIAAVGADVTAAAGAATIDLEGRTLMPGLVNAHGHVADTRGLQTGQQFYTRENLLAQLRRYADYGVTTVMSLGGDGEAGIGLRDEQTAPIERARLFVAGPVITATTPEAAAREVDRVAAMKPDFLKIRVDDNLGATAKMPIEAAVAVIERGHARGLRVAAHVFYLDDAKALIKAGVDFIAHSIRDQAVDAELIQLLTSRSVCVCPTLMREVSTYVYEGEPAFFSDPFFLRSADPAVIEALRDPQRQAKVRASQSAQRYKTALNVAMANVKLLADAGVAIASGTDTGPPGRFQGYFEHLELELLAKAGLPPATVLASATGTAARCLAGPNARAGADLTRVGFLRQGYWADFVVLRADPLQDVRNTRTIESVWIGGRRLER
jgi:imidazolonepropionase-like amidohydrolase